MSGLEGFCEAPYFADAIFDRFPLGKLTPCFEGLIALGLFHVFAIIFSLKQLRLLSRMRRLADVSATSGGYLQVGAGSLQLNVALDQVKVAKGPATSIESAQLAAAFLCALAPLLQLIGRTAKLFRSPYADTYDFVSFELVSLPLEAVAWATLCGLLFMQSRTRRQLSVRVVRKTRAATSLGKEANWTVAFISAWAFAVHLVKLQSYLRLYQYRWDDAPSDLDKPDFFGSTLVYCVQWVCIALLAVGGQCFAPKVKFHFDDEEEEEVDHSGNAADTFVQLDADADSHGVYQGSSVFSKLFFSWMSPLLKLGFERCVFVVLC